MTEQTRELTELAQKATRFGFEPMMSGTSSISRAMS
jgi:hypothetical protein